ncbi:MAG TPA: hypothetical protein VN641_13075 [Urbifossiella sp.]|jgi:hypothetical protein|nr:hypothetical protein [Urbifossiella sp.]
MYSMVLMAAMLPSGDTAAFGKHKGNCTGGAYAGCNGSYAGASNCHGSRGGFLGMRNRGNCNGGGCNGSRGGFLGHKHKGNGCTGSYAAPANTCGCCGTGGAIAAPPTAMPSPTPAPLPPKTTPKAKTSD